MKKMAKFLALIMSITMIATAFTACDGDKIDNNGGETTTTASETTKKAVTTTKATTTASETTTEATTTTAAPAKTTTTAKTITAAPAKTTTAAPVTTTAATTANTNVSGVGKYVYNSLPADEKELYNLILDGVKKRMASVTTTKNYKGETIKKVYQDVYFQEPELFWFMAVEQTFTDNQKDISLNYKFSEAEQKTMQAKLDAASNAIIAKFPANASTFQKLEIIHDTLVLTSTFSKDGTYATTCYGPIVDGVSQCEGYAKSMAYMCNKIGVDNVRITGNNDKGLSHAWNKLLVNGKWYNMDITWDDPIGMSNDYLKHTYFLVPDILVNSKSHFPVTTFTPPTANSIDMNWFVQKGRYASSVADAEKMMTSAMIEASKGKKQLAQIMCNDKATYDAVIADFFTNGKYNTMANTVNSTAGCNKISVPSQGSDPKTYVVQINIAY